MRSPSTSLLSLPLSLAVISALLMGGAVTAATINVPGDQRTIQAAVDAAAFGDVVLVAAGTYKERITLKPGVTLRSAGDDSKGQLGLARAEATILDCDFAGAEGAGVSMAEDSILDGFTVTGVGDMVFRVCFLDSFQGYVNAKFARDNLKATKAAILYDQAQAYSSGLAADFKKAFTELGGTIVAEQAYTGGNLEVSSQLQSIKGAGAEVVFLPGYYSDVGTIIRKAREGGISQPFLGGDGWDSVELAKIAGDAINGNYYSNHYSHEEQRPEVQNFVAAYGKKYGGEVPDGLAALGYDAAMLLFDAMERAPSLGGTDLAAAIAATKDFKGVTGTFSIDEHRNAKKSAVILEYKDGVPTMAARIEPQ